VVTAWDSRFGLALAGLAVLSAAAGVAARLARAVGFFTLWFLVTLAPSVALTLLPAATPIVSDRFLYLPSVGFCAILAVVLRHFTGEIRDTAGPVRRPAPILVFGTILVVSAALTIWRNEDWKDDLRLYYRMADTEPRSFVAAANLGFLHLNRLEAQEATVQFERALKLAPDNARVLVGYGLTRAETGQVEDGLRHALRGLRYELRDGRLHSVVGRIYLIKGDFDRASAHYREATRLQPHMAPDYFTLAFSLLRANHPREALRAFEDGLEAAKRMQWHHRLVDRVGGELFATRDSRRAIGYWTRYVDALRSAPFLSDWERSELAEAEEALRKLARHAG
jgi:tetratricopeptide (TPR) repeat protein